MSITISKEVEVSTYVDVDVDLDIDDVCEFIESATDHEINEMQKEINARGIADITHLTEFDVNTIRHLVERANIFGLDDMMDSLSREAERIGLILQAGK